ncbi:MAG: alpha/beta hydrolase, partial [Proteobacteria bacterium]|nr:alpha/beta hydrolase [Pseudomonadota bacterium]
MNPKHSTAKDKMVASYGSMTTYDNYSVRYGVWVSNKIHKRGSVILLGGRTEFLEKYADTIGELNHRGFDVYGLDWRGQGLSSRMLSNRHKGFVRTYDDYINDLALFVDT